MKVLLDGDMIAYKAAENAIFRLVTNDEVIVCQTDPKEAWINYNKQVEGIALALDVDPETDIWHCFTDRSMFRRELSPDYKANRKSPKPMGFSELKAKALELPWSFMHRAVEADDLIGIFATQLQAQREPVVICSGDKDLLQIPGYHYWPEPMWGSKSKQQLREWFNDQAMDELTPHLFNIPNHAAERFFWAQALAGDSVDGIAGVPGMGMVRATKEVGSWDVEDAMGCWEKTVQLFAKKGGSEDHAKTQARLVRILRNDEYDLHTSTVQVWNPPTK